MRVLLSNNPDSLRAALSEYKNFAVVEAEFGGAEVMGSSDSITLNHHVRPERQCPCLFRTADFPAEVRGNVEAVGISHFDLDTLGGLMALRGTKPEGHQDFWRLAAFVDLNGPHAVENQAMDAYRQLAAVWAWSQKNRLFAERDGSVTDVTDFVAKAEQAMLRILNMDADLMREGATLTHEEALLNASSFRTAFNMFFDTARPVLAVVRVSDKFTNHLYRHEGLVADLVVALNTTSGAITVSRRDGTVAVDCRQLVQTFWGELAGGHAGIAGSPRGQVLTQSDLETFVDWLTLTKDR